MVLVPPSPPRRPRAGLSSKPSSSKPSKPFNVDAKTTLALRRAFKSLSYLRDRPASSINPAHYAALRAERARQAPPPSPPRRRRRKPTNKENAAASSSTPTASATTAVPRAPAMPRAPLVTTVAHAPWMRQPTSPSTANNASFVSTPSMRGSLTAGSRVRRAEALTVEKLWIDGNAPPPRDPGDKPHQECAVCKQVKTCPVISGCGHSHCYPCIRVALEYSFLCPSCRTIMTAAPFRCWAEEQCIAHDHPDWQNTSRVTYSFDGLEFPRYM
ncbi:hypothetical protein DFH06DRAFT_1329191 [Mycena polygramma]|nr:hypothetical protein DFH06DRAFT_1329191 [Mycena polygramma]